MKNWISVLFLSTLVSMPLAHADVLIGGGIGRASVDQDNFTPSLSGNLELGLGGEYFQVTAGFWSIELFELDDSQTSANVKINSYYIVSTLWLGNEDVKLGLSAGYGHFESEASLSHIKFDTEKEQQPFYGLGVQFPFDDEIELGLNYKLIPELTGSSVNYFSLSASYRF